MSPACSLNYFTNPSLIPGNDEEEILFKSPPDPLHVFLGSGNKIFDSMRKAMIEDIQNDIFHPDIYDWAQKKAIVGLKYRG